MRTVAFGVMASIWCVLPLLWGDWYSGRIRDTCGLVLLTSLAVSVTAGFRRIPWGDFHADRRRLD